jgi:oxepin-CoA hydrolase/3-oxo-5,6-dehydrosuberyl-CoA semialdehyde dehydrogenase
VPRGGVAVHINAFNFPVWGLLEKFAPSFLAGMPCIGKPATATSYLTEALVRLMHESGLLPAGSLQLVIGSTGDLLDRLDGQDVVTFTGSADTAAKLRVRTQPDPRSVPFNAEADSLNCAILAPDVTPDDEEFDLFVKEVAREMTVKAGQKCTAIRRAIVPRRHLDAVAEALRARLKKVVIGDPAVEGVRMGALASRGQQADVAERVARLGAGANDVIFGAPTASRRWARAWPAAPSSRRRCCAAATAAQHGARRRGLRPGQHADALRRPRRSARAGRARQGQPGDHAWSRATRHRRARGAGGCRLPRPRAHPRPRSRRRVHRPRLAAAAAQARRPGPRRRRRRTRRRARGVALPAARRGAGLAVDAGRRHRRVRARREGAGRPIHPFRKWYDDLAIGDSLLTHRRTVSEADIVNFGGISGDYFYMHFDEVAAKDSPLRQAHRARLLRALGGGRAVRLAGAGAGAGQLRAGHAALRQAGGHRRHHPGAADLQAQDRQARRARASRRRAWWPGTCRSPTSTASWSPATTS